MVFGVFWVLSGFGHFGVFVGFLGYFRALRCVIEVFLGWGLGILGIFGFCLCW